MTKGFPMPQKTEDGTSQDDGAGGSPTLQARRNGQESTFVHWKDRFRAVGKGSWAAVADADWNSWRWQLQHRITSLQQLEERLRLHAATLRGGSPARPDSLLTPEERLGVVFAEHKLSMAITPFFFNLIDPFDSDCPIRRQVIPHIEESHTAPWESDDPCGEDSHSPVPGLVHRYPDRALFLVTDRCAAYCRYCTRSRLVSGAGLVEFHPHFEEAIRYIERTPTVRDVLLSGGDPLLFSDEKLEYLLARLRAIPHVEFLRIGTRIPIFLPQRVTPELCAMLRKFHPLWVSVHMNHPRECTAEVKDALGMLADAGIPLGNQTVLLRGINDDPAVMKELIHRLLIMRVRPYYIYQCDPIVGSAHLRSTVAKGIAIIEALRGHTTGYAVPQFVIDAPGGGGKVPINPEYLLANEEGRVIIRNYEGKVFIYTENGVEHGAQTVPRVSVESSPPLEVPMDK
jgi:lysine 2,3-aminomutase